MKARVDSGYCSKCAQVSLLTRAGLCAWCDHPVAPRSKATPPAARPKAGANVNRGVPVLMGEDVIEQARAIYETGKSLRAVARELLAQTGYASEKSLAVALGDQFRHRGFPVRGRVEQVVMVSTKHGKLRREARDPEYVRAQRLARGEIRGVTCAGVRTQYPRKGERCSRPARSGSAYCYQHDPGTRDAVAATCAAMRERKAAA